MSAQLAPVIPLRPRGLAEPFLTKAQLCEQIGFSARWIEQRVALDLDPLPSYVWGRSRRFRLSEVTAWMERRAG